MFREDFYRHEVWELQQPGKQEFQPNIFWNVICRSGVSKSRPRLCIIIRRAFAPIWVCTPTPRSAHPGKGMPSKGCIP